jgi:hypothetical protein
MSIITLTILLAGMIAIPIIQLIMSVVPVRKIAAVFCPFFAAVILLSYSSVVDSGKPDIFPVHYVCDSNANGFHCWWENGYGD